MPKRDIKFLTELFIPVASVLLECNDGTVKSALRVVLYKMLVDATDDSV